MVAVQKYSLVTSQKFSVAPELSSARCCIIIALTVACTMDESPVATSTRTTYQFTIEEGKKGPNDFWAGLVELPIASIHYSSAVCRRPYRRLSQRSESGAEGDVDEESLRVRSQVKRPVECKRGCPSECLKALESTLVKQRSTEGVVIQIRRTLKNRQEIPLVSVLA